MMIRTEGVILWLVQQSSSLLSNPILVVVCIITFLCPSVILAQPQFDRVSSELNLASTYSQFPYFAGGLSFCDYDQDGWDDITIGTDSTESMVFYKNFYGTFKTTKPIVTSKLQDSYAVWIDYDNDGIRDLFRVAKFTGSVRLLKADSMLNLTDVTVNSGLSGLTGPKREGALFADFNNDGRLDLYVASYDTVPNSLFIQDSNNVFQDISSMSGACDSIKETFHAIVIDYNEDGWLDLYLANDFNTGNELYRNNGDSTFTAVGAITGTNVMLDAMGLGVGDFDGDLDLDIHVTDRFIQSRLLRNNGDSTFSEVGVQNGVNYPDGFGWGNTFFDADLDGDEDLYVSGLQTVSNNFTPSVLFINDGTGQFTGDTLLGDTLYSFSNAVGDFDNDRKPDIITQNSDGNPMSLWRNTTNISNQNFTIKLKGCSSNIDGFGAKVIAYDDTSSRLYAFHSSQSFQSQNSGKKIIPILNNTYLDSLKVFWPSGNVSTLLDITPDQSIEISECDDPKPYPIILVPQYADHNLILCPGDSILLCVDGDYQNVSWSNNESSDSIYVTSSGLYNVTVTNQFGITASSTKRAEVVASSFPEYTVELIQSGCFNDGSIEITAIPEWAIHEYSWSNGSNSHFVDELQAGIYTVTVTNNGYCPIVDSFEIWSPDSLDPISDELVVVNPTCFNEEGVVNLSSSGGISPHKYKWSTGQTGPSVSMKEGTYSYTITDSVGCKHDSTFMIDAPPLLEAAPSIWPDTNSQGVGKAWVYVLGGTPPYYYSWSDSLMQASDTAFHLKTGQYMVTVSDFKTCDTIVDVFVPDEHDMAINTLRNQHEMKCSVHANGIDVHVASEDVYLELYDLKGAIVPFESMLIQPSVHRISISKSGLYFIRDANADASCKVYKP